MCVRVLTTHCHTPANMDRPLSKAVAVVVRYRTYWFELPTECIASASVPLPCLSSIGARQAELLLATSCVLQDAATGEGRAMHEPERG